MRWTTILLLVAAISIFSSGISIAQSGLVLSAITRPAVLEQAYKAAIAEFDLTGYYGYNIELKPLTRVTLEIDNMRHMQRLADSSV